MAIPYISHIPRWQNRGEHENTAACTLFTFTFAFLPYLTIFLFFILPTHEGTEKLETYKCPVATQFDMFHRSGGWCSPMVYACNPSEILAFFLLFLSCRPTKDHIVERSTRNPNPVMASSVGGAKDCSDHRFRARTPSQLLTLHQHRTNNQYRTGFAATLRQHLNSLPSKH